MPSASLVELQDRADKLVRRWTTRDCGCYREQTPTRVIIGPLTFLACATCFGRVSYDRRHLRPAAS